MDFFRDSNQVEIDLIIKKGNALNASEIKSSKTFYKSFLKNLNYFENLAKEKFNRVILVYSGYQEQDIGSYQLINYKNLKSLTESLGWIS